MKSAFTMLYTLVGAPQDTAPTAGTDYALSEQTVDRMSSDKKAPAGVGPRAIPDLSGGPPTGPWRRAAHAHVTAKPRRAPTAAGEGAHLRVRRTLGPGGGWGGERGCACAKGLAGARHEPKRERAPE